jgi:hypothetical protein
LELNEADFVKARLTALAIETDNFCRDDIYTLFVTTRIVNFLKGLSLDAPTSLLQLISQNCSDPRTQVGFDLLNQLFQTGRLFFSTARGGVENRKFRTDLFARVLSQIGAITCQDSGKVLVDEFARKLLSPQFYSAWGTDMRNAAPPELGSSETSPP